MDLWTYGPMDLWTAFSAGGADNLSGGEGCPVIGEQDVEGCEFGRLAGSPHGGLGAKLRDLFRKLTARHLQRGPDRTGSDSIDPNALLDASRAPRRLACITSSERREINHSGPRRRERFLEFGKQRRQRKAPTVRRCGQRQ
jgi:hypothetical protein